MNAVPFDTLKMAQRLEAAGFAAPQAAGASEALAEALTGADLATKGDIAGVKSDIASLRTELKSEIGGLRAELKSDLVSLRTELKGDTELLRRDMTIKLGGMIFIAVGVLLAAMRYMPPHP
jgi:hypothetical protein